MLRQLPVVLLSFCITLIGRLYRRFSGLVHRLSLLASSSSSSGRGGGRSCSAASSSSSSSSASSSTTTSSSRERVNQHRMLPHLPNIQVLSSRVVRILGLNPGAHTLQGTCTYLVGTGKRRLLVDTGEGRAGYARLLQEALAQVGAEAVQGVLLTHHHYDHTGGVEQVRALYGADTPVFKRMQSCSGGSGGVADVQDINDGAVFKTEGATLRAVYTPGHTDDHVAFYFEEEDSLFSGDCILGHGTTVFDDLYTYMNSLKRLLELARQPRAKQGEGEDRGGGGGGGSGSARLQRIYPGHGAAIEEEPVKVIEQYIAHREEREKQILAVLLKQREQSRDRGLTPLQIVHAVYEKLPAAVVMSAQWNVEHHLDKLQREGKAASRMGMWRATPEAVAAAASDGKAGL